jgi:hypothetical protein
LEGLRKIAIRIRIRLRIASILAHIETEHFAISV